LGLGLRVRVRLVAWVLPNADHAAPHPRQASVAALAVRGHLAAPPARRLHRWGRVVGVGVGVRG
jgi:hypothetical protein